MVEWLIENEDMDFEDAVDFISYNSSFYYGEHYPVIYYKTCEEDDEDEQIVFTKIEELPNKD